MLETRDTIEIDGAALDRGYKNCRQLVKRNLKAHAWLMSNISGDNKRGVNAILANLLTTLDMLDLESVDGLSLDVWHEIRDDTNDAFSDKYANVELAALVDTCRRYEVPKQYIFDPLRGADLWIRSRKFETFDELESFCSYVGGAAMASLVPVMGVVNQDYELPAIACGKAVMLTQILANCVDDMKRNRVFLAKQDLADCEVDVPRLKMRRPTKSLRHLVRLYVSRLEKIFHEAGKLIACLDYDGRRTVTSLLGVHWKMAAKMQQEPELILSDEGILNSKERFGLRSRHLLGMEGKLPFVADSHGHH